MAEILTNNKNYYDIADTIRQMKEVNTTYKPREMASALKDIYSNEVEGTLPLSFQANGNNLLDYKIDGASGGVGDRTKNLANSNEMIQGYWAYANGDFVHANTWVCTPKIECSGDTPYTYQFSNASRWSGFVFYDENGRYISTSNVQNGSSTEYRTYTAASPSNARYLAVNIAGFPQTTDTISVSDLINFQLEKNSTPTDYEPYGYKVPVMVEGKNLLPNTATSQTINGVTFMVNNDGSVTCNGTSSAVTTFAISIKLNSNINYVLSGSPKNGSRETYRLDLRNTSYSVYNDTVDNGDGINFTVEENGTYLVCIRIAANYTCNNITFYPMIRLVTIEDDTYEPYIEPTTTNIYLDEPIEENESISLSDANVDIPTIEGTNTLIIDTTIQPSNVYIQAPKDTQEMIESKSLLQPPLNKFGANISTLNPIIDYSNAINDIYNKLPKITQSGTGLTITPVQNGQVDDFKMIGVDLEQNGTPTPENPQEIEVVEGRQVITDKGKNLLNPYTEPTERYGITASYNQNTHVYTFNGTCTRDNVTFILSNNKINFTTQVTKSITFWVGGSCTNFCDIRHFDSNYNLNVIYSIVNISSTNNKISETSNYTFESPINYATIRFDNGSVANNLQIKVMVTDDDNTDFEPYYNPVSYNIDLHGKNVFNLEKYPFTPKVAYSSTGYQELNWTGYSGIKDYFPINGNTTYSFSNSTGLDIYYGLVFYDKNKTIISNITAHTTTFTTPSNCEYIRFSIHTEELPTWVQIEEGSSTTNYEEYYDYKLAKMPNTDYKNRIYKNNGNWYFEENAKKVILDGSENIYRQVMNDGTTYRFHITMSDIKSFGANELPNMYSNKFVQISRSEIYGYNNGMTANTSMIMIYYDTFKLLTLAEFKNWLNSNTPIIYYVLNEPVITQITNTTLINQLEAISVHTGTNIITISNDNNIIPEIEITRLKELEKLA